MANIKSRIRCKAALISLSIVALLIANGTSVAAQGAADIVDDNQLSIVRLYIEISADAIFLLNVVCFSLAQM